MQSGRRRPIGWSAFSSGLAAIGVALAASGQGSEQTFIKEAMQTNIAEVRFGALAAQRAENPAVREFGETLEADHRAALEHAMTVARSLQMEPPEEPSLEAKGTYDGIAQLSAAQFDAAFVSHMIVAHEAAIAKYTANSHSNNPALAAYVAETLPTMRAHLATARALQTGAPAHAAD
jgi:putative membrane protein